MPQKQPIREPGPGDVAPETTAEAPLVDPHKEIAKLARRVDRLEQTLRQSEDIRDTMNSTVSPGCNSSAAKLPNVPSDDAPAGGVSAAEEEEDGMATYRRRRRAVCFTRARSPTSKSKEGRRAASGLRRQLGFLRSLKR